MSSDRIESYLSQAVAGSLIGAIAARRNQDITEFADPDSPELRALFEELCDLGIYPQVIANHSLTALAALFCEPDNADRITTSLTDLLWTILGDPKSGAPPEIYRRAGTAMHVTLLGLLCPSVIDPSIRD
jgi:hypothetical protein